MLCTLCSYCSSISLNDSDFSELVDLGWQPLLLQRRMSVLMLMHQHQVLGCQVMKFLEMVKMMTMMKKLYLYGYDS